MKKSSLKPFVLSLLIISGSYAHAQKSGSVLCTPPTLLITPPNTICIGSDITLSASGALNYLWSNGATSSSITVSPSSTTTYTVVGWSTLGCNDTAITFVKIDVPTITVCCNDTIHQSGDSVILSASGVSRIIGLLLTGLVVQTALIR